MKRRGNQAERGSCELKAGTRDEKEHTRILNKNLYVSEKIKGENGGEGVGLKDSAKEKRKEE